MFHVFLGLQYIPAAIIENNENDGKLSNGRLNERLVYILIHSKSKSQVFKILLK